MKTNFSKNNYIKETIYNLNRVHKKNIKNVENLKKDYYENEIKDENILFLIFTSLTKTVNVACNLLTNMSYPIHVSDKYFDILHTNTSFNYINNKIKKLENYDEIYSILKSIHPLFYYGEFNILELLKDPFNMKYENLIQFIDNNTIKIGELVKITNDFCIKNYKLSEDNINKYIKL